MPTILSINKKLNRQRRELAEEATSMPKSARANGRRPLMTEIAEFCRYPGDPEGCCQSLIQAWGDTSLGKHCIIEGLRANRLQCRQVLKKGLYDKTALRESPAFKVTAATARKKELEEACKQVVLFGYPLGIGAIHKVFYEAYHELIRCIIHRIGIKDDSQPSADDVSQQVLANLHEYFHKGGSVKGRLATYVARVTANECFRALKDAAKHTSLPEAKEVKVEIGTSLSTALLPPSAVECWEDLDERLLHSKQGNLINRIIFAQRCLETCSTGQKLSAKQLMADWQRLAEMSEEHVANLHRKVVKEVKRFPDRSVVQIAADLINAGLARPHQMAIVFAAGTEMSLEQTLQLFDELRNLSAGAIHTRICRIQMALQLP